jgi:protein-S-isoprenylcysteine O-methyltransferase Ste14
MLDDPLKIVFLVSFVIGSIVRRIYTRGYRRVRAAEERRTWWDSVLVLASSVGLILLPFIYLCTDRLRFADYHLPAWMGWVGAPTFAAAVWLLWRSHVDLGKNWSPVVRVHEGHTLVTHGVYRRIRHPMYAAHWLWGLAQFLLLHNWIAGPALLVFFAPLYFLRVTREEQMMIDQFGEEYRAYMGRTGRLLPQLRR